MIARQKHSCQFPVETILIILTSSDAEPRNDDVHGDDYEDLFNWSWELLVEMITTSSRVSFGSQHRSHLLEHLTLHSKREAASVMFRCSWNEGFP
ncbi:hypothetical protein HNY73_000837 [Argiope bruennichi]|uniref:Uncharacterized protein n=1 Tax=Argiope bruennichi TaxID=94029 RepID=A0A8T0FZD7_ARGBR|nr:hypothetical protein HNY73_000837 [Argiope bruennichi]